MLSKKAIGLINDFGAHAGANAMRGGGDPEDIQEIEERYRESKLKLKNYVEKLEKLVPRAQKI